MLRDHSTILVVPYSDYTTELRLGLTYCWNGTECAAQSIVTENMSIY